MSSAKDFVEGEIANNKVVIFTTLLCPYSQAAVKYFKTNYPKEPLDVIDLNACDRDVRDYLAIKTGGWRTVPMIYISGVFVGGYDDLRAMPKSAVDALMAMRP